jgi:hypothetical protein
MCRMSNPADELRLTDSHISIDVPDAVIQVTADARMLSLAMQACVGMLVSLVEASNAGGTIQIAAGASKGLASCEMRQDAYRLSADQFSRLADLEWRSGLVEFRQVSGSQQRHASRRRTAAASMRGGPLPGAAC